MSKITRRRSGAAQQFVIDECAKERRIYPSHNMSRECTIREIDHHSCDPFVLREIENLMGLSVEDDLQDPRRIRLSPR